MGRALRVMALAGIVAVGALGLGASPARAQGFGGYYGGGYPGGYYGGYAGPGFGYYGGGYGVPAFRYYGNGGHDFAPHWHTTRTPFGSFGWHGNGVHDLLPHEHTVSPYGGYRGYSAGPFGGVTTSYYSSTPYTFMPW
jgi:hypothetical protein